MFDPITLLLAGPAAACYAAGAVPTWQNPGKTCQVFHSLTGGLDTFMFRGTETAAEWFQDFNPLTAVDAADPDIGWVHAPSLNNVREVLPFITATLAAKGWPPFYLAGHSKGARELPIAHALLKHAGHAPLASRGFEPPRAGGSKLADYLATENIVGTQTYNACGDDIVTLAPAGFGWEPSFRDLRVQVSDALGFVQKHIMTGVISGLGITSPV
jgi:Lipase (class 3)